MSLVLQSSAGPITADIDFESSIFGPVRHSADQYRGAAGSEIDPGETLELTLTVNTPTGTQTVTLSADA